MDFEAAACESVFFLPGDRDRPETAVKSLGAMVIFILFTWTLPTLETGRVKRLPVVIRQSLETVAGSSKAVGRSTGPTAGLRAGVPAMLYWALVFFIIAIIAAIFGFSGVAAGAATIAQVLFFLFLILFVVAIIVGLARRGGSM